MNIFFQGTLKEEARIGRLIIDKGVHIKIFLEEESGNFFVSTRNFLKQIYDHEAEAFEKIMIMDPAE